MLKKWGFRDAAGKIDWLVVFVCMVMTSDTLGEYVRAVFMRIPSLSANLGYPATHALYGCILLLALRRILRKLKLIHFIFPMVVLLYYLLSYSLYPNSTLYLDKYFYSFFFLVLPMYFLGITWSSERYMKPLYVSSFMALVLSIIHLFCFGIGKQVGTVENVDHMSQAYGVLIPLSLITYVAIQGKRKVDVFASLVGFAFLIALGTRGPIFCYLLFIIVCSGVVLKKKGAFIFLASLVPLAFIAISESVRKVLIVLVEQFERMGLSTRILHHVLEGEFWSSHGRDVIRDTLLSKMHDHEFVGYGFFADRAILPRVHALGGGYRERYAHNIILEFWVDFGRITGSAILVVILLLILRALVRSCNPQARFFIVLFTCCALGQLMFSSSYLLSGYFFLLLGLLMNREKKQAYTHLPSRIS